MQIRVFFVVSNSPFPYDGTEVVNFHIVTSQASKHCQKKTNQTVRSAKNKPVRAKTLSFTEI